MLLVFPVLDYLYDYATHDVSSFGNDNVIIFGNDGVIIFPACIHISKALLGREVKK